MSSQEPKQRDGLFKLGEGRLIHTYDNLEGDNYWLMMAIMGRMDLTVWGRRVELEFTPFD